MWFAAGEFVVGSLLCSERFFSGYSDFPLSSKSNISKFKFDLGSGGRRTTIVDVLPLNRQLLMWLVMKIDRNVYYYSFIIRYLTLFYYLNEPKLGGETAFPVADNLTFAENEVRPIFTVLSL